MHTTIVPYQSFPTADGYLVIAVGNDSQFRKLCDELGHPEWADDMRFVTNSARVKNRNTLLPLLEDETRKRYSEDLLAALELRHVPCGPINGLDKVFADPQVVFRGMKKEMPHPCGPVSTVASPLRLSDSEVTYEKGPPLLGQHTQEVLIEKLAYQAGDIEKLISAGIVN